MVDTVIFDTSGSGLVRFGGAGGYGHTVTNAVYYDTSGSRGGGNPQDQRDERQRQIEYLLAEQRSEDLWRSFLDDNQQSEYEQSGYVTVHSRGGLSYRITRASSYNVLLLDWLGRPVMKLCVRILGAVPLFDRMLGQKLMLESEEKAFWETANKSTL